MKQQIRKLIEHLNQGLVEREEAVKLALLATLAGEHLLILGPPGTAKSELARRLKGLFDGGGYFERLLTKFSVPEELFGPLSIKALEQDRYHRLTEHYLPSASIAFIDEIFKANSAILNALLTLLNEREFDNGAQRFKTPLITVIGASNELPEGEELNALYDRFLLRYHVDVVSQQGFESLLHLDGLPGEDLPSEMRLTPASLRSLQAQAQLLSLDSEMLHLLKGLRLHLNQKGLYVSDRRWFKLVKLLKMAALTNGREQVSVWDGWLLQHCLWDTPEQREIIQSWYAQHLGANEVLNPERITRLADTWAHTLEQEQGAEIHLRDAHGEKLYLDMAGRVTAESCSHQQVSREDEVLFLAPPDQPDRDNGGQGYTRDELGSRFFDDHYLQCHINGNWVTLDAYTGNAENRLVNCIEHVKCTEPVRYSEQHIRDRVAETQSLLETAHHYKSALNTKLDQLEGLIEDHLWIEGTFSEPARDNLQHSFELAGALADRIESIRDGFDRLPRL